MTREEFYQKQVDKYIKNKNSNILVLGAGPLDRKIFEKLDFKNVTFSNLENTNDKDLNLYENIHEIKIEDSSYDYCIAHACIHHSSKPHSAILELYRVCLKGALIIEARDSVLSRLACYLNLSEEYEFSAVEKNKVSGGVDNTNIPNYVYRWTEREIFKLMKSYKPEINHEIKFDYSYNIKFTDSIIVNIFFKFLFSLLKKQQNLFSIFINKNANEVRYNEWIKN